MIGAAIGRQDVLRRTSGSAITSKRAPSTATEVLRKPNRSKAAKTMARSALTQRPDKK